MSFIIYSLSWTTMTLSVVQVHNGHWNRYFICTHSVNHDCAYLQKSILDKSIWLDRYLLWPDKIEVLRLWTKCREYVRIWRQMVTNTYKVSLELKFSATVIASTLMSILEFFKSHVDLTNGRLNNGRCREPNIYFPDGIRLRSGEQTNCIR